ncbi:hypothetical protein EGW08_022226 [Elysia chlorotica]|uniref:C2H2-type domain-containing protein n=1 Tax=Elysia chlorotica TaxID=188477 RepID=A0A3S1B224_ELYCH|nr:hypothetical protein EGW08_022226 [Elysia chlorotica]
MSNKTVSLYDEAESRDICLKEESSYIKESEKQDKNSVPVGSIASFPHNLQNNFVHGSGGFNDNNATDELNQAGAMDTSRMILSRDDSVMYISAEGNVPFNPKDIASTSTEHMPGRSICLEDGTSLNPNYLVVVDNAGATRALSSNFERSIVMRSETCYPDTNSSITATSAHADDLKSANAESPHQQTIMVFDGQLQSDSILSNVLVAYDHSSGEQMSFSTDPTLGGTVRPLPQVCQESFIHLEQAPIADGLEHYSEERNLLHKSTLNQNFLSAHTLVIAQNPLSVAKDSGIGLDLHKEIPTINEEKEALIGGLEDSKLFKQKEDLKLLEKYHLQHHEQEAKKKQSNQTKGHCSQTLIKDKRKELTGKSLSENADVSASCLNKDINDDISVFSHITAKINAKLLELIPGCQRFLLEKMEQSPPSSQIHMSFESNADCTFSGSLTSLIELHNSLKRLLNIDDVSLLDFKRPQKSPETHDRSIMCSLLQPFISSRGRQPKYSFKAKAMGFTSDFEALLKVDDDDEDLDEKPPSMSSRVRKRKRGRPRKVLKGESGIQTNFTFPESLRNKVSFPEESEVSVGDNSLVAECLKTELPYSKDLLHQESSEGEIKFKGRSQTKVKEAPLHETSAHKTSNEGDQDESHSIEEHHPNAENTEFKFFCSHCSFKTKRHSQFLIHMRCHKGGTEKTYHCKKCDFVCLSLSYLKRHEMKHKENLFRCSICNVYQTDKKALLHRHIHMKHSAKSKTEACDDLQCHECNFKASSKEDLIQHKLVHGRFDNTRNKMVYSCPECKRTLRSKMHLHRHIRDVHGPDIRPYLCDNCGKAFKRTDALKQHKALHESKANRILPHKCTTCGKAFRSVAHLKEHLVIHTSERPYLCQYCGAAFKTQAVQKRHILTLHIKPRGHVCSVCCRQFNTKHALQRHENTHTKPENTQEPADVAVGAMEDGQDTFDEKEKRAAVSNIEAHVAGVTVVVKEVEEGSGHISVGSQGSSSLVQDIIGTASGQSTIEDQIGSENERIQQAYIEGNQEATTLYYFTGDLNSL